jgi:hypothetical protein
MVSDKEENEGKMYYSEEFERVLFYLTRARNILQFRMMWNMLYKLDYQYSTQWDDALKVS